MNTGHVSGEGRSPGEDEEKHLGVQAMMNKTTAITIATLAGLSVGAPYASAQGQWNRKVEAVRVLPTPGGPAGAFEVQPFFSVEALDILTETDLGTDLLLTGGSTNQQQYLFDILFEPPGPQPFGCNCPPPLKCLVLEGFAIGCVNDWLICDPPTPFNLMTGDVVEVLLRPTPGALPDSDSSDDSLSIAFNGDPIFWDRRVVDVSATPSPAGDSFFDIDVEIGVQANYDGPLNLAMELDVLVEGVLVQTVPVPQLDLPLLWNQCAGACGSPCVTQLDGSPVPGLCVLDNGDGVCKCEYSIITPIPAVPVDPGDEIVVILRPAPGALPELPGFPEENDEGSTRPGACPADFDGDGFVGAADLAQLLGAWNSANPIFDLNNDGFVGAPDLAFLLGSWGACFPV